METENQHNNCVMLQKRGEVFIRLDNLEIGLLCPLRDNTRQESLHKAGFLEEQQLQKVRKKIKLVIQEHLSIFARALAETNK